MNGSAGRVEHVAGAAPGGAGSLARYRLLREIGRGSYGRVFVAAHNRAADRHADRDAADDGVPGGTELVAVKAVPFDWSDGKARRELSREVDVLRACDSPHVLSFIAAHIHARHLWLVTEYCPGGSLLDALRLRDGPLSADQIAAALAGATSALVHLHARCCIHRDVKASNLLLTRRGELKLADFGVAVEVRTSLAHLGPHPGGTRSAAHRARAVHRWRTRARCNRPRSARRTGWRRR